MATSGTTDFNLSIDDLVEEAFERCGMRMTAGYQLSSARRSLNLLFLDWASRGLNLWTIEEATEALVAGSRDVELPTDTVNVLSAVIRITTGGQIYVERSGVTTAFLYPASNAAYTLVYYRIRRMQDAGDYTNTTDVNFRFLPSLASGLAYMLALKYAPDRMAPLKQLYEEDFQRAALSDRDPASVHFVPDYGG